MSYNSLRDRYGVSVSTAPISFVKAGPDEYRSRDDLWVIRHRYKSGYQAHHEWRVTAPDGSVFNRYTHGYHYLTLSDAVQAINECVALGVIKMLSNLFTRLHEQEQVRVWADRNAQVRDERQRIVESVLVEHGVHNAYTGLIAARIVDQLFGMES